MFKVAPVNDNIFVKLLPIAGEKNGLIMVDTREAEYESRMPIEAEVLSVSDFINEINVGDRILIMPSAGKWIGDDVTGDKENTYRIIKEEEALALVEDAS